MVFYQDRAVPDTWYHYGAPVVIAAGVLMRRLKVFDGIPLVMVGLFFAVSAIPGWSPFENPVAASLVAIALGHAWIAAMHLQGPLRQFFGGERSLAYLLVGIHAVVLANLPAFGASDLALLLLGAATVALHGAMVRNRIWLHAVAGLEVLVALEIEAFSEGRLGAEVVIWILLGLWLVNLFFYDRIVRRVATLRTMRS